MATNSSIEWTETTWNPVTGCTKISPGCDNCYAIREARRLSGNPNRTVQQSYAGTTAKINGRINWTGQVHCIENRLDQPLHLKQPRRIFVNSMSDLFHEDVPDQYIRAVSDVMKYANWHTYQVLTKRAHRLQSLLKGDLRSHAKLSHIWWGVSVENRKQGLPRIKELQDAPAAIRFLSIEPLLEDLGRIDLSGIHWVIVGGESGPRSRPMQQSWVESIRDQCEAADVAFFFKQWGMFGPAASGDAMIPLGKKAAGRLLAGRTWDEYPKPVS
jgi:protein gp37